MLTLCLLLGAVDTEPALPADPAEGSVAMPGGGYIHTAEDGARRVVVPATVMLSEGQMELFACAVGGKDYESIVRIDGDVQQLDLALVLIGLHKGPTADRADAEHPEGDRVLIFVQWDLDNGETVTYSSHDLILNASTNQSMPNSGWTFVGEVEEIVDAVTGQGTGRHILRAARSKSVIATFRDSSSVLDNPMTRAAHDDTAYQPNSALLPPPGTAVRLVFRAPSDTERAALVRTDE